MTKQVKLDMFSMRLDGYTLQEIADRYGVSYEYVRRILSTGTLVERKKDRRKKWIYPNIKRWAESKNLYAADIANRSGVHIATLCKVLKGASQPNKTTIDALLRVSGMTYEEFFYQPGKEEAECQRSSQS